MKDHGYVPIKLYLQNQALGQIWLMGHSLPTPAFIGMPLNAWSRGLRWDCRVRRKKRKGVLYQIVCFPQHWAHHSIPNVLWATYLPPLPFQNFYLWRPTNLPLALCSTDLILSCMLWRDKILVHFFLVPWQYGWCSKFSRAEHLDTQNMTTISASAMDGSCSQVTSFTKKKTGNCGMC